jgi:23S rRNA (cytidine2498-2'-O)-methyltransferase
LAVEGPVLFSAAEDYVGAARWELADAFGQGAGFRRLGPDFARMAVPGVGVAEVAAACRSRPLAFVRHLTGQVAEIGPGPSGDLGHVAKAVAKLDGLARDLALQTWVSGASLLPYGSGRLHLHVAEALARHGHQVARAGRDQVLSLVMAGRSVLVGLADAADALSDWPGGRVRLARQREQISRAEFKLEELATVADIDWPRGGLAADLGASPGGWTRQLRAHGLRVIAVDPADLHPAVAADPGVEHVRTTAGRFLREHAQPLDMVVNDMRMTPLRSAEVVVAAAACLRPGGQAIVTLKLTPRRPAELLRQCLDVLDRAYTVTFARQLQHNRHEVTVVARRD